MNIGIIIGSIVVGVNLMSGFFSDKKEDAVIGELAGIAIILASSSL